MTRLSAPSRLGRTVVLGFCDIAAAGIRTLEGLSSDTVLGCVEEVERETIHLSGADEVFKGAPVVEAIHFAGKGYSGEDPLELTLLKINAHVGRDLCGPLSLAIVDILVRQYEASALDRVIVAAAVQTPKRLKKSAQGVQLPSDSVCVMTSDCELLPSLEALPSLSKATRLSDAFLTQLVRLCCIEELPLVVLAHESYRLAAVSPAQDGTDKAIQGLGKVLASALGLTFNLEVSAKLEPKSWSGRVASQGVVGYI